MRWVGGTRVGLRHRVAFVCCVWRVESSTKAASSVVCRVRVPLRVFSIIFFSSGPCLQLAFARRAEGGGKGGRGGGGGGGEKNVRRHPCLPRLFLAAGGMMIKGDKIVIPEKK